jgi:hypothetical protein
MTAQAVLHILTCADHGEAWRAIEADTQERPVTVVLLQKAVHAPPRDGVSMVASQADCEKYGAAHPHRTVDYVEILQLIDEHDDIRRW